VALLTGFTVPVSFIKRQARPAVIDRVVAPGPKRCSVPAAAVQALPSASASFPSCGSFGAHIRVIATAACGGP
jgi:hypothetical protein